MKTIFFLFGALMVYTLPAFALNASFIPPAGMEGIYEYKAVEAPYEYQNGTIELKRTDNKWTAKVTAASQTFTAQEIKVEKTQVQFRIYVEGNPVLIKLQQKENKLTGTATSSEGVMKVVAERKKIQSKK
ncbi:MAG TPA: hypothetical protein PLL71_01135 [Agriterribacter sp.]|nr:hypothetical protein [Agriterribacter sp.]HRQ49083.1 hypothetical protein [Agriterribacter sp.]